MQKPLSTSSYHFFCFVDLLDLFVSRTKTSLAQAWVFPVVGPCTWNNLPPTLRAKLRPAFLVPRVSMLSAPLNSYSVRGEAIAEAMGTKHSQSKEVARELQ